MPLPPLHRLGLASWIVRLALTVLVAGIPQLVVAMEDGVGTVRVEEARNVWRVLFVDRVLKGHPGAASTVPSAQRPGPSPSWAVAPATLGTGAERRSGRDVAMAAARRAPAPPKAIRRMLRVRARHESNYV